VPAKQRLSPRGSASVTAAAAVTNGRWWPSDMKSWSSLTPYIARATTYQELGPAYFDRRQAERSIRRCVRTLERLGHKVIIEPLAPAA
jgi:hypothetical protein